MQIKIIADTLMFHDTVDPFDKVWRKTYYNTDTGYTLNTLVLDTSGNLEVTGQLKVDTITSKTAAANDASIALGARTSRHQPHPHPAKQYCYKADCR